jgi:hypothetical protein
MLPGTEYVPCQACLLRQLLQISQDLSSNLFIVDMALDGSDIGRRYLLALHTLDQGCRLSGVTNANENNVGLQAVSVYEQGGEQRVERVHPLDFFESDVFSV